MQSHRNQNQQMSTYPRYQNNFRQNKYSDDSQERKPNRDSSKDSYSDSLSKERNGQPDYRG